MNDIYSYLNYISMLNSLGGLSQADSARQSAASGKSSFYNVFKTSMGTLNAGSMDDIFEEAASAYGVDVNLLKAIGKAESGFDASATSCAGAMGVMQLMPGTAQSLGVSDPYDARSNIMGGAKYISGLLDEYGGNVELALAAYNAGSGNVAKYGGVPPFEETRNYIQKIMGYMKENISTGETVPGGSAQTVLPGEVKSGLTDASSLTKDMGLKMIELMKLKMQMQFYRVVSGDEEESGKFF